MRFRKDTEVGIFYQDYYYYWYFGLACPGLGRRMAEQ